MFNRTYRRAAGLAASASAIGLLGVWTLGWAADPSADGASATETAPVFGPGWGAGKGMGMGMGMLTRRLDLSDEQRTRIDDILRESRTAGEQFRGELQSLRDELQAAVTADEFYEDQVRISIESKTPVMVELMMLGARTMSAVRAELTPEQRLEAAALMERFQERRGSRRHGFFGPRHN